MGEGWRAHKGMRLDQGKQDVQEYIGRKSSDWGAGKKIQKKDKIKMSGGF